jgi:molybdopterin-guanine dinucleotide biosynthesis protein A
VLAAEVSAVILAGGRATRFGGVAKHELVVGGQTILARQRAVLAPRVAEIVIAAPHDVPGLRTVRDAVAGAGPLAGIAAGLAAVRTPWALVVAGDMPDLRGELVDLLRARADEAPAGAIDAVAFRIGGLPEPLLCALRVAPARAAVDALLGAARHKASALLTDAGLRVAWIDEAAARAVDPELRGLRNVNAPADLERA